MDIEDIDPRVVAMARARWGTNPDGSEPHIEALENGYDGAWLSMEEWAEERFEHLVPDDLPKVIRQAISFESIASDEEMSGDIAVFEVYDRDTLKLWYHVVTGLRPPQPK